MHSWFELTEKALTVMQEASQELLSRGLIVDPQIFQSAVQHQTLHALGELKIIDILAACFVTISVIRSVFYLFLDLDKEHMVVYNREFTGRRNYNISVDETVASFKHFLNDTVPSNNLIELR